MNEDDIEYLPTVGEPLSIKTAKQGREGSISKMLYNDRLIASKKRKIVRIGGEPKTLILDRDVKLKDSALIVLAHRVLKFEKSTKRQKEFASNFIHGRRFLGCRTKIIRINKSLLKQFGNKYRESNLKRSQND